MANPALVFDENAHHFTVTPQSPQLALEFGPRLFFTSLTTGLPADQLDAALAAGQSAFNNLLVFPALLFHAEAVVLVSQGTNAIAAEVKFRSSFEFGFVQGTSFPSIHLEYWGSTAAAGRTIVHIGMPLGYEVDTDPLTQPWTHIAANRFKATNVTAKPAGPLRLKIESEFSDHPMVVLKHTIGTAPNQRFLRWVKLTRDFRTIFCAREKATNTFLPISATNWRISFDHWVRYTGNGANRTVDNKVGPPNFPRGGTPSNIEQTDRDVVAMAQRGAPFVTHATLFTRLTSASNRTETDETPNTAFDTGFWS